MKKIYRILLLAAFQLNGLCWASESLIEKVLPAVVNILAEQRVERSPFADFFGDPFLELFGDRYRSEIARSLGTGVLVKTEGVVITCYHVVRNARVIKIKLSDDTEYDAEVVATDEINDLAALQLKGKMPSQGFPVLTLGDSDKLKTGNRVYAIGNAFGLGHVVTDGIISNPSLKIGDKRFVVTNAAINPGNSGGALIDATTGELLGIPNAIISKTGASHGVGFAISVKLVRGVIESLGKGNVQVVRPWPGVVVQDLTPDMANDLGSNHKRGVIVQKIHSLSTLKALNQGDVIVAMNNKEIQDSADFRQQFQTLNLGSTGVLKVMREDQEKEIQFIASAPPEAPSGKPVKIKHKGLFAGLTVTNLSPAVAVKLGIDDNQAGVVVVDGMSANGWMVLQKGDIILNVNNKTIETVEDLQGQLTSNSRSLTLTLKRGSQILTLQTQR